MPYLTKSINESGDILYTLYDNIIIPTELTDVQYKSVIKKWNRLMVDWADAVFYYNGPCNLDHGIEKMREHGIMRLTKGRSANYVIQNVHVGIQSKGSHRGSPRGEKSK